MPEWLIQLLAEHPSYAYVGVGLIFVLCGVGLPLPEELVLVSAGFLCYQGHATYWLMALSCAVAILVGDLIPFLAGAAFGPRLLRLRWMRLIVSRARLAMFDRWFRRRGDMVILIARFIPGLRVVAFFTGGMMRMRWGRFLVIDLLGITLTAPTFVFIGWHFGDKIEKAYHAIRQIENSILWACLAAASVFGVWYWLRRRARRRRLVAGPRETFVEQTREPQADRDTPERPARPAEQAEEPSSPVTQTPDDPAAPGGGANAG